MRGKINENSRIRQHDSTDCAAASLCSILGYWGLKVPLIEVRHACGITERGASIHSIIVGAGKFGMDAYGASSKSKETTELKEIDIPVILHLKKENGWLHFVVYYGYKGENALIMDPQYGKIVKVPFAELSKIWSGYIVCITPSDRFIKGDRTSSLLNRLKTILKECRRELSLSILGSIGFITISYSFSLFLQYIIDTVLPSNDLKELGFVGILVLALTIIISLISYFRGLFMLRAALKSESFLITGYLRKLLRCPTSFFDWHTAAELNTRISDAYRIRNFVTAGSAILTVNIISLTLSIIILVGMNWKLALACFSITPLFLLLYHISIKYNSKYNRKIIESAASFQESIIGTLSNIRSLKHFNSSNLASSKMEMSYLAQSKAIYNGGVFQNIISGLSEGLSRLTFFIILIIGGGFCINGDITIGELVSFYTISTLYTSAVIMLIESTKEISEARISAQRLFEITEIDDGIGKEYPMERFPDGKIKIENITFAYPGQFTLFENFSTEIKRGAINIIKGKNGSGKSTLGKLLLRDYSPDKGRITVGEIDISLINPAIWRENVAIIPQKPELLNSTILENITFGRPLEMEKVVRVSALSGLTPIISNLPEGLMSNLGENGNRLSGGEKVKLSLARGLYSEPQILIIDEGASNLDRESRINFYKLINELNSQGMTIVLITHEETNGLIQGNIIEITDNDAHQ